jgi:ribosomal protein L12E/L44/L45/RPP1/RPP2
MKHLAAYLLLGLGGNTSPSAKDIKAVLESVGIEADNERLTALLSELKGKDINEVRIGSSPQGYTCCARKHMLTQRTADR